MHLVLIVCSTLFTAPVKPGQPSIYARAVLAADLTPKARFAALAPFVIGQSWGEIERVFGKPLMMNIHGIGLTSCTYELSDRVHLSVYSRTDGGRDIYYKDQSGERTKWNQFTAVPAPFVSRILGVAIHEGISEGHVGRILGTGQEPTTIGLIGGAHFETRRYAGRRLAISYISDSDGVMRVKSVDCRTFSGER